MGSADNQLANPRAPRPAGFMTAETTAKEPRDVAAIVRDRWPSIQVIVTKASWYLLHYPQRFPHLRVMD